MKISVVVGLLGLSLPGMASAECPSNLDDNQMVECITIEGSGANYQSWKKEHDALADDSTISPVTGKDVATVIPAAGKVAE